MSVLAVANSKSDGIVEFLVRFLLYRIRSQVSGLDSHVRVAIAVPMLAMAFQTLSFVYGLAPVVGKGSRCSNQANTRKVNDRPQESLHSQLVFPAGTVNAVCHLYYETANGAHITYGLVSY